MTTTPFDNRLNDYNRQLHTKAQLCAQMKSQDRFTLVQYQAAEKTVRLALALFSPDESLSLEQVALCRDQLILSDISIRIMRESLDREPEGYINLAGLVKEKIKELRQKVLWRSYQEALL